jgi:uncharacterized membrane protein
LSEQSPSLGGTYLRLTLSVLFWGGTFVAGRLVSREMVPESAAFIRFFIASLLLLLILLRKEGRLPPLDRSQAFGMVLLGLTGVFAYNLFFFKGLQSVEAGRAALIIASTPVFFANLWPVFDPGGQRNPCALQYHLPAPMSDPRPALAGGSGSRPPRCGSSGERPWFRRCCWQRRFF